MNAIMRRAATPPVLLLAVVALAACAGRREPAEHQIAAIESAIQAASPDAGRYVPDKLRDVQARLDVLRSEMANGKYDAVIAAAPALLTDSQELIGDAAVHKADMLRELNNEWPTLADSLPQWLEALQKRAEALGKNRKAPAGIDLAAARSALDEARGLWSKAQSAFAAGNLAQAVDIAHSVKDKAAMAATALKMPQPA
jgi:hypothetical protein